MREILHDLFNTEPLDPVDAARGLEQLGGKGATQAHADALDGPDRRLGARAVTGDGAHRRESYRAPAQGRQKKRAAARATALFENR